MKLEINSERKIHKYVEMKQHITRDIGNYLEVKDNQLQLIKTKNRSKKEIMAVNACLH